MHRYTSKIKSFNQNVRNIFILIFFCIYLISCSDASDKNKTKDILPDNKENHIKKPLSNYTDTLVIDFPAAVIYTPDSLHLEKLKAITEPMGFESNMHECIYLLKFSRNEIKNNWPKIKIVETGNAGLILFKSEDGNIEYIDLNSRKDFCGIFLFDRHKKALFTDLANIATELGFYFSK